MRLSEKLLESAFLLFLDQMSLEVLRVFEILKYELHKTMKESINNKTFFLEDDDCKSVGSRDESIRFTNSTETFKQTLQKFELVY